jgi:hypothetical protein
MSAGRVKVPQKDGEITLTFAGNPDDRHTFKVKDNTVTARDERDLRALLLLDGAKQVEGDPPEDEAPPVV